MNANRGTRPARRLALPLLFTAALASPAAAQLPSASAPALGMGDNYTAVARGFNAVSWNPAMLGLSGGPLSSFTILSVRGVAGLDPVTAGDLAAAQGEMVPASVREEWLDRIIGHGRESGSAGTEVTLIAASVLRFGVQLSTQIRGTADMGPGGAQLLLFGNAGRTGQAEDIALDGSSFNVAATSTVALGYAQPIFQRPDGGGLALGATVKYTLGHAFATGMDAGSAVTADPLAVDLRFPIVQTDTILDVGHLNNGGGWGLDLGLAWQGARWTAGVTMKNVVDTFEWDRSQLLYRPGVALVDTDSTVTDFDPRAYDGAPQALKDRVDDLEFRPSFAAGLAFRPDHRLGLSADVRHRLGESRLGDPKDHVGVGAELRPLAWLPLRAGAAKITGGQLLSGGFGLEVGAIAVNASVASRSSSLGTDAIGMFTFTAGLGHP
jgi:hypothetical protein